MYLKVHRERDDFPEALEVAGGLVRYYFRFWLDKHPDSTLGDLWVSLTDAQSEMHCCDSDATVRECWHESDSLREHLELWGEFSEADNELTIGARMGDIEDDIENVEELIEGLTEAFEIASLPSHLCPKPKLRVV